MNLKKTGCLALTGALAVGMMAGCGNSGGSDVDQSRSFTAWIVATDGAGTFYQDYEDNPAMQWINNQYWDTENHTLGSEGNGKKMNFSFQAPITGAEKDNFNTMIGTGEYPELIALDYSASSPRQLCEDGVLLEITEYVESYMPNYLAFLEEHPEFKPFATYTDENGEVHYYGLYGLKDGNDDMWEGFSYRRDWVVEYCEPTEYVWDWNSAEVTSNGHPDVTPLSRAVEQGNLKGWKKNEVSAFTSTEGDDPNNDYEDNVIFPSGLADPYTISDWEWMMEGFAKAIEAEGFAGNTSAYCVTVPYPGFNATGDLVSSFGGGAPMWYIDKDGNAQFGGTGENFKTYVECMNIWNSKGWLDTTFETRTSDMYWEINLNGFTQGMVGLSAGGLGTVGTTIRATCASDFGKERAMVFGCRQPINDVYGGEGQMYQVPDCFYQLSRKGGAWGFTDKCEGKDMETLFSMLNWMYSQEGGCLSAFGLNAEQYASMTFDPDLYKENGLDSAYHVEDADGIKTYVMHVDNSTQLNNALKCQRFLTSYGLTAHTGNYNIAKGWSKVTTNANNEWTCYSNDGYILEYSGLFDPEDSNVYSKTSTYIQDYMGQKVPEMIKNGLDGWNEYCAKLNKYAPEKITGIFQKYLGES